MDRRFVVVSGLPGSGKSFLAGRLAPLLDLPLIDKDDILERLFDIKGVVGDPAWRRALSRESDVLFRAEAERSKGGAILVSFWHLPGMPPDSGTPAHWLPALSAGRMVNLCCECPPNIATARFCQRRRHPGHLDSVRTHDEVLKAIQSVAACGSLDVGTRVVHCDTSLEVDVPLLAKSISEACAGPDGPPLDQKLDSDALSGSVAQASSSKALGPSRAVGLASR